MAWTQAHRQTVNAAMENRAPVATYDDSPIPDRLSQPFFFATGTGIENSYRSSKLAQSCSILLKAHLAVGFLLRRGRFRLALLRKASAVPLHRLRR